MSRRVASSPAVAVRVLALTSGFLVSTAHGNYESSVKWRGQKDVAKQSIKYQWDGHGKIWYLETTIISSEEDAYEIVYIDRNIRNLRSRAMAPVENASLVQGDAGARIANGGEQLTYIDGVVKRHNEDL